MTNTRKSESRSNPFLFYALTAITVWTALITSSFLWNLKSNRSETLEAARIEARTAFEKDIIYRRWNANHGGVYIPITKFSKPNPYLDVPERDIVTPSGKKLTKINPAFMTRQVHELEMHTYGIKGHITSLNPIRPENAPDPWEVQALNDFESGIKEASAIEEMDNKKHMRLMRPLLTEKSCLKCHASQGYKLGDIRGGISISIPMAPHMAIARHHTFTLTIGHGLLWLLGLAGIGFGMRHFSRHSNLRIGVEKTLGESEEKFRILAENVPGVIYLCKNDEHWTMLFLNDAVKQLTGYPKEEFLSGQINFTDIYHPDDTATIFAHVEKALAEHAPFHLNYRIKHKSGGRRWIDEVGVGIYHDGELQMLEGYLTDITERKHSEEALQESEEKFRQLADLLPQVVYEADDKGILTFANRIAFDLFGYAEDDFKKGLTAFEMIIPAEREMALEKFQETLKGEPSIGTEYTALKKDGSTFPALIYASPIISDGKPAGLRGIVADLSEFKRTNDALQESEEKYRELVENANSIILKMDTQGKITLFNEFAQNFFGYSEKEIIGSNVIGTIGPRVDSSGKDLPAMIADIGRHPERYVNNENENILKNGMRVWVAWTNKPILDKQGDVIEILCIGNDITDRIRTETEKENLESQLQQAHKMEAVGTLAGGIAHEFNNLLGIIVGNAELAMSGVPEHIKARGNLEEIRTASMRARDVVRQLLSFSRESRVELKAISLIPIVTEALKLIRSSIPTTIEIRQDISAASDTVKADLTQINQVIINLCTNAAHAMVDQGGILKIGLENVLLAEDDMTHYHDLIPGNYIRLTVSDTGEGIPQELSTRIFDPFFTTKEVGQGTGLGLSVVHGIIKKFGGDITFQSEPGRGTTFHVFFPVIKDKVETEVVTSGTISGGSERILFVDDEESLVFAAKDYLEDFGYQVISERDPVRAFEIFKDDPEGFDLLITDMTMPHMTGDMLAREIMSIRPDIPVILCSGYSEKISEENAKDMGIKAFVMKPALVEEMATTIRRVLDQKREGKTHPPKHILIVDDEEQMRLMIRQLLESSGFEISEAPEGKTALRLCREKQPDLMITDLIMPEKEGIETIVEIKRDFPEIRIIAISGGGQSDPETYLSLAKNLGAERTFVKPFEMNELLKAVKDLLF